MSFIAHVSRKLMIQLTRMYHERDEVSPFDITGNAQSIKPVHIAHIVSVHVTVMHLKTSLPFVYLLAHLGELLVYQ